MNKLTTILSIVVISATAACSSKKLATKTPATPAETATTANLSTEQMEHGKSLWSGNCGKCHTLFTPESRNVASWERILPAMTRKAKMNESDAATVTAYIMAFAKK